MAEAKGSARIILFGFLGLFFLIPISLGIIGASQETPAVKYVVATLIGGFILYLQYRIRKLNRAAETLNKVPFFHHAFVGMYVRLIGRVTSAETLRTPGNGTPCQWFVTRIKAQWQVKAKKPSKGMKTIVKPLDVRVSGVLQLDVAGTPVEIAPDPAGDSSLTLTLQKVSRDYPRCPVEGIATEPKYKTYVIDDQYLLRNDTVTVYGKLVREAGRFVLRPAYDTGYPMVLFLGEHTDANDFTRGKKRKLQIISALLGAVAVALVLFA